MIRSLALCFLLSLTTGCHFFGGARLREVSTASGKPSNVASVVAVMRSELPVTGLPASSFKLYENGQLLDSTAVELKLLDPRMVASMHTVLLVDLTQTSDRTELAKGVATFVKRARMATPISVFTFDGGEHLRFLLELAVDPTGSGPDMVEGLVNANPSDKSRNLRGAVAEGLAALDARLKRDGKPIELGTLVVFSRGPDLAGRVSEEELKPKLGESAPQLYYIGVEGDATDSTVSTLGRSGHVNSQAGSPLPIAFQDAASAVAKLSEQYYLLSYCSPSRAGERQLRIEVSVPAAEGADERDTIETHFDSTGFTAGCNSSQPPRFVVAKTEKATPVGDKSAPTTTHRDNPSSPPAGDVPASGGGDSVVPPPANPGYAP